MRLLLWIALTVGAIFACQRRVDQATVDSTSSPVQSEAQTDCQIIQHELGETEVCGQPQRIVVLGPYLLEPLLALGVQPTAFADHEAVSQRDYDNPSQQIPYLEGYITQPVVNVGTASNPSVESILKVQPDLILGTEWNANEYETFSNIAPTLLLKWGEPEMALRAIAQAVNRTEQAEQVLIETEQRVITAREDFAPIVADHPKVLLLSSLNLQEMYLGTSAHGMCSSLIEEMGFQLVTPPSFEWSDPVSPPPISIETLPQMNEADAVIMLGSNFNSSEQSTGDDQFEADQLADIKQSWEESAIAQSLDASKSGRVYFIPAYLCLGLPGPIGTELYLEELKEQLLAPY